MASSLICRACYNEISRHYISLDTSLNGSTVLEVFNHCTRLGATLEDELPTNICIPCSRSLQMAYDFINTAHESDQILRSTLAPLEKSENEHVSFEGNFEHNKETNEGSNKDFEEEYSENIKIEINNEEPQYVVLSDKDEIDVELIEEDEQSYIETIPETDVPDESEQGDELEYTNETDDLGTRSESSSNHGDIIEDIEEFNCENESNEMGNQIQDTFQPSDISYLEKSYEVSHEKTPNKPTKQAPRKNQCCEICGKFFSTKQKLTAHNLVHTKEKKFACNLCPKRHATIFRLRDHMKTHENIRNHECEYCKERFFSKSTLICHLRRHTGERPYKCEICGKAFTQASIMKTHAALHTGKTVECNMCSKKFTRPSHLILHRRSHTGERPYMCTYCPNRYRQKSHLDRHMDTHLGVKHTCEICGKSYSKKSSLNTHKFVHMPSKQFQCVECNLEFATKDRYNRHLKNTHKSTKSKEKPENESTPNDALSPINDNSSH